MWNGSRHGDACVEVNCAALRPTRWRRTFPMPRPDRWNCPGIFIDSLRCARQYPTFRGMRSANTRNVGKTFGKRWISSSTTSPRRGDTAGNGSASRARSALDSRSKKCAGPERRPAPLGGRVRSSRESRLLQPLRRRRVELGNRFRGVILASEMTRHDRTGA